MGKVKRNKDKSIALRLCVTILILVMLQSLLWITTLSVGGVMQTTRQDAYNSFAKTVKNRRDYLHVEMKNRWMNAQLFLPQFAQALDLLGSAKIPTKEAQQKYFEETAQILASMMRTTTATGAFVVLNDNLTRETVHSALYLRDYDPRMNDANNRDIYVLIGSNTLAASLKYQLDSAWTYSITLDEGNQAFYNKPYEHAYMSGDPTLLGYWSKPFKINQADGPVITYSMPLMDSRGEPRGVVGIELSVEYFRKMIPGEELSAQDSLGYLLGTAQGGHLLPTLTSGAFQEHVLNVNESLSLTREKYVENVYTLNNHHLGDTVYACVQKLSLYEHRTPFEDEEWYLVGFVKGSELLSFYNRIQFLLIASLLICIVVAVIFGIAVGYKFTKPVRALAKRVRESRLEESTRLGRTGYTEIDELSAAIEVASRNFLETADKMSRIIELVNVPIGAFEYREDIRFVFATDRLWQIFSLTQEDAEIIYSDKTLFIEKLKSLMSSPEQEEENVYKISPKPHEKWVKIETVDSGGTTLGIATDVTEDMLEKQRIRLERDYDYLTRLRSRAFFRQSIQALRETRQIRPAAALLMMDLDGFKAVNDTYGHEVGDDYLKAAASVLGGYDNDVSIAGRRSGDEFVIFFYGFANREEVRESVRGLFRTFQEDPFTYPDGSQVNISVSGGVCWFADAGDDVNQAMIFADTALYMAKKQDKGYFVEYTGEQFEAGGADIETGSRDICQKS